MCLPAAKAKKANNDKIGLNRMAESSGESSGSEGGKPFSQPFLYLHAPPFRRSASFKENPNTHGTAIQIRVIGTGLRENSNKPVPCNRREADVRQEIPLAKPQRGAAVEEDQYQKKTDIFWIFASNGRPLVSNKTNKRIAGIENLVIRWAGGNLS